MHRNRGWVRTATAVLFAGVALAGAGCGPRGGPAAGMDRAERQCVMNMADLTLKASSASMDRKDYAMDRVISPADLVPGGTAPVCPLGGKPYAAFTLNQGPACPNSEAHTERFRALSGR